LAETGVSTGFRFVLMAPMMGLHLRWSPMKNLMRALGRWFGTGVGHAFGNPLEERQQQPPNVGVQPFSGTPYKA
jgi:hypothetical protein